MITIYTSWYDLSILRRHLLWFTWLDMLGVDLMLRCQFHQSVADKFQPIISSKNAGLTSPSNDLILAVNDSLRCQGEVHFNP